MLASGAADAAEALVAERMVLASKWAVGIRRKWRATVSSGFSRLSIHGSKMSFTASAWDNSMANSCNTRSDGSRRADEWKGADDNNTWDNSMAQTVAPVNAKKPHQQRSNEWNNSAADDWGGEEDWHKVRRFCVMSQVWVFTMAPFIGFGHRIQWSSQATLQFGIGPSVVGISHDSLIVVVRIGR